MTDDRLGSGFKTVDRRAFVSGAARAILGLGAVGGVLPLCTSCSPTGAFDVPLGPDHLTIDVSTLTQDGQLLETGTPGPDGGPVLVVRRSATSYVPYSTRCTHAGCVLEPPSGGILQCPCHGSEFDTSGNVVRGPARSPLPQYPATYDPAAGTLTVSRA